jgi:hypothetical protein
MLIAPLLAEIAETLSPDLKLKIISLLAGIWNPVVLATGLAPNTTNVVLAPVVIKIRLAVTAVLVDTVLAVSATV